MKKRFDIAADLRKIARLLEIKSEKSFQDPGLCGRERHRKLPG
jgi:hypothetical protein